ncbi:hypothetical protein niasHS_007535 [Heterodera schachtii]|uniref:Actin-interacting protein 1 n=1 Tax=Heterodera schachtii TaxID=97005 RepID=A0ABD2JXS3_HETSC
MTSSDEEFKKECTFASLPRTVRGMPLVISSNSDGTKFLYCNGNSVFIRDEDNIADCDVYTEHATLTTVAKYSPSEFYIASGDQSGKIRFWDTTQSTHILKSEFALLSGAIRDISWSEDSKRVAIVGEGHERFGHVFLFDTGTSNGNLSGQSRPMNSIDFRPTRPYRLVSGSEDNTVAIFEGPPFKFKSIFHEHSRFVQSVRYNKDGSLFAAGGMDGKVILFEGQEGGKVGELVDETCKGTAAHSGGVFALNWHSGGIKLATASGDKTIKIWDVPGRKLIGTVSFGSAIEDQQLAVVWLKNWIVSVSLSGFINYICPETLKVCRVLRGHNKSITALTLSEDRRMAFTADFEGHITRWNVSDGSSERVTPQVHKSQVSGLSLTSGGLLISIGWDDSVAFIENALSPSIENVQSLSHRLSSQPRGVANIGQNGEKVAVACHRSIFIFTDKKQSSVIDIKYEGTSVAIHPNGILLAVGGNDSRVHLYDLPANGGAFEEKKVLQHAGAITSVNFSPNGKHLVATDIARKVVPYSVDDGFKVASEKEWSFHTARINCCAWSSNSRYIATGSLDTNVMVWDLQQSGEHPLVIRGAHSMSAINGVAWLSDNRLLTVGQDSNVKQWTLKL